MRGDTIHARLEEFVGIVSPSYPRPLNEIASHSNPFVIRTRDLAELQGLLVPLCRRHNMSSSDASLVDVHGQRKHLHSELGPGVNGLVEAHVPNSQENWEERLEMTVKRKPSLKLALG
jgi:hypothetical protein